MSTLIRKWRITSAPSMSSVPTTGNTLYRPVRDVTWPERSEAVMIPATSGSMRKPLSIGDAPRTICRNCGSTAIPPNIVMPTSTPTSRDQREHAAAEQSQRQQGVVAVPALDEHEEQQPESAEHVAGDGRGGAPAPRAALLGDEQQRHESDRQQCGAGPVDASRPAPGVRQVEHLRDDGQRDRPDRHVDEEDPAPAVDAEDRGRAREQAADHRARARWTCANTARKKPW